MVSIEKMISQLDVDLQKLGDLGWVKEVIVKDVSKKISVSEGSDVVFFSVYPVLEKPVDTKDAKIMKILLNLNSKKTILKYSIDDDDLLMLSLEMPLENFSNDLLLLGLKNIEQELKDNYFTIVKAAK